MTGKDHALKLLAAETGAANAHLPATYAQARTAIAECEAIDECKTWADKAAALASYARMANDNEMLRMATRIRDRAIRRAGELLVEVEPQPGARTDREPDRAAPTRFAVAKEAGLSRDQAVAAIRVARVPSASFEQQVESDTPPTVTALAEQGKRPVRVDVRDHAQPTKPTAKAAPVASMDDLQYAAEVMRKFYEDMVR